MKRSDKLAVLSITIAAVPALYVGSAFGFWAGVLFLLVAAASIWQWLLSFTAKVRVVDAKILKD